MFGRKRRAQEPLYYDGDVPEFLEEEEEQPEEAPEEEEPSWGIDYQDG